VLRRKREGDDLSDIQCPGVGRAYHDCVQALASIGFHLIIDDDLPDDVVSRHMSDILEKHETVLVGIRCPLPELQRREAERSDRAAGSARRGFETIHTTLKYDLTVDTSELMAKEAATRIARFVRERCSGNEGGSL